MVGLGRQPAGMDAIDIGNLAPGLAAGRIEGVAQDGEQPGAQVGAALEAVDIAPGLEDGVLHQIVCRRRIARQAERKGTQSAEMGHQLVARIN